jgi:hypothetical protein
LQVRATVKTRSRYKILQEAVQVMVEAIGGVRKGNYASRRIQDENSPLKARTASLFFAAEIGWNRFRLLRKVLVLLKNIITKEVSDEICSYHRTH